MSTPTFSDPGLVGGALGGLLGGPYPQPNGAIAPCGTGGCGGRGGGTGGGFPGGPGRSTGGGYPGGGGSGGVSQPVGGGGRGAAAGFPAFDAGTAAAGAGVLGGAAAAVPNGPAPCLTGVWATACPNPEELPLDVSVGAFNGGPIEGAWVEVSGPRGYAKATDAGGVASFLVVPGGYSVSASAPDYISQSTSSPIYIPPSPGVCHNTTGFTLDPV